MKKSQKQPIGKIRSEYGIADDVKKDRVKKNTKELRTYFMKHSDISRFYSCFSYHYIYFTPK